MQSKSTANVYINGVAADATLKSLRAEAAKLRNELANLSPTSDEFAKKAERFREVDGRIQTLNGNLKQTKGLFGQLQTELGKFGTLAIAYLGFDAITGKVGNMIKKNAELSDSMADVMKTTGMTELEVKKLNETFGGYDTRTARSELLSLAKEAGKLGISGRKDVEAFVSAADKINVALGEDLGRDAITQIGKLVNVFRLKEEFSLEDAMLKMASAMNTLGASSEASEGFMVDFMERLGGVAANSGFTVDQVLALGATLDSLGQSSETSSTALSGLFMKMAKDTGQFARIAGKGTKEFKELMEKDAFGALMLVLQGAGKTEGGMVKMAESLGDLGIDAARMAQVFVALTRNTDMLGKQVQIASDAFDQGTSIIDEYNIKNNNLAANLEKLQKWLGGLFVNNAFLAGMKQLVDYAVELIKVPVSEKMEQERIELRKVELQLRGTNLKYEEKMKLIRELHKQYPEYFGNMDIEKIKLGEVLSVIEKINAEMINKIIIQKEDERIEANNLKAAEKKINALKAEDNLMAQIIKTSEKHNITLERGASIYQQAMMVLNSVSASSSPLLNYASGRQQLTIALSEYIKALHAADQQEKLGNAMLLERERLMERLGIKQQDEKAVDDAANKGVEATDQNDTKNTNTTTPAAGKSAYEKALEELTKYFNVEKALIKNNQSKNLENKEEYDMQLLDLEMRQLEGRKALLKKFNMDTSEVELQMADARIKQAEELGKRELEVKKAAFEEIKKALSEEEALINENFANGIISEEQQQLQLQELVIGGLEIMKAAHLAYGDDVTDIERKIAEAKAKFEKQKQKYAKETLEEEKSLAEQRQVVESQLRIVQQENLTDLLAATRGFFKENANLARAALVASKAAAIAEIVIKAQVEKAGISARLAANPIPGARALAVVQRQLVNARMGASIALITAQTIQELQGFSEGGFTGAGKGKPDGSGFRVAGVVHEDEYVTPKWMLRDPVYANVASWLEDKRVSRTPGYEAIKEQSSSTINNLMNPTDMSRTNALLEQVLIALQQKGETPVVIGDDKLWDLRERLAKLEKAEQNARFS